MGVASITRRPGTGVSLPPVRRELEYAKLMLFIDNDQSEREKESAREQSSRGTNNAVAYPREGEGFLLFENDGPQRDLRQGASTIPSALDSCSGKAHA